MEVAELRMSGLFVADCVYDCAGDDFGSEPTALVERALSELWLCV